MITESLKKPHPFIFNAGSILIPGFIAFLLIFVFSPFGSSSFEITNRLILCLMFGLVSSFGVLLVTRILKWLTPGFMREERWTVGKELILILIVVAGICLLNFVAILVLGLSTMQIQRLFQMVIVYTIGISIIPVGILVLFEQFSHQRKKLQQAKKLTERLRQLSLEKTTDQTSPLNNILLEAENGNVELQLHPKEILFINSDGNYVEIYYQVNDFAIHKKLIRNRLKNFIPILPKTFFFQCHKSFIVNKMHIIQVEGNARNLELIMRKTDRRIPVSRSKTKALSEFLKGD